MYDIIKEDLLVFTALIAEDEKLLEFVVNNQGRNNFETANNKLENAKNNIKGKMSKASKEARQYLQKQHDLIQIKQDKLHARKGVLDKRKEEQDKNREEISKQNNNQNDDQKKENEITYDPNSKEHAEIIRQYHIHKMAHVRAQKAYRGNNKNNQVKEDEELDNEDEEMRVKKLIAAGRLLATNSRINSESARKNSSNNIRMSKQKMVTQARTRTKF